MQSEEKSLIAIWLVLVLIKVTIAYKIYLDLKNAKYFSMVLFGIIWLSIFIVNLTISSQIITNVYKRLKEKFKLKDNIEGGGD